MEPELLLVYFSLLASVYYFLFLPYLHHQRHFPPCPRQLRLPIIGHMHLLNPLLHQSLHRLSLRDGPDDLLSLYLGSRLCVFTSSTRLAKQLLQDNEISFNCRIDTAVVKRLTYDSSLAFAPFGDYWRFIKKLTMNELLGQRGINKFQRFRAQETGNLLRLLAEKAQAGEAVNITAELLKLTNNLISRMLLGETEEARDVVRDATKIIGEFNVSDVIWLFKKVDFQGFGKRVEDVYHRFDALVERIICKREEMRKNKQMEESLSSTEGDHHFRDFLDILIDCAEDESSAVKIERIHIKALVMDFFTAGTDTTAIAVEWALLELMNNPLLLQKAQEEIHNVVGKSRVIEESDCPNLPYLQAIVKETFRLHPPVPLVTRRCVADCKIENYVIPKDSIIFVNAWSIARDPNNWENPLEFRPERFLKHGEGGSIDVRGQHFQLLPFGSGRRMCPAVSWAKQQVPALLGAIIQCFDFHVVDPEGKVLKGLIDMDERPGLTAPAAQNLVCVAVQTIQGRPIEMFGC